MDVAVYSLKGRVRSQTIADAMAQGVKAAGDNPILRLDTQYNGQDEPIAVFYGFEGKLPKILYDYKESKRKAVFVDLGYWGRGDGGKFRGYHKVSINDRHPTAYFQNVPRSYERFKKFNLDIAPWRKEGRHILLAGMGDKASKVLGIGIETWERLTLERLRAVTDRPIIYRPKPSWLEAKPIEGTKYSPRTQPLSEVLADCHAVVAHHSNVAVDGLLLGIPCFCFDGVAKPMGLQNLNQIDKPYMSPDRRQWAANVAWTQFNVTEMQKGFVWRTLKDDGLIP